MLSPGVVSTEEVPHLNVGVFDGRGSLVVGICGIWYMVYGLFVGCVCLLVYNL